MTDITTPNPMMGCGHAASGVNSRTLAPSCVSCAGIHPDAETIIDTPDLTGRMAKCHYCGKTAPSSPKLPFFMSTELYSRQLCKHCPFNAIGHRPETRARHRTGPLANNHVFEARTEVPEFDDYYCGCMGWD